MARHVRQPYDDCHGLTIVPAWLDKLLPSWAIEILGGIVALLIIWAMVWLAQWWWGLALDATGLSLLYERMIDPNGFSWSDMAQREVPIVVLAWLAHLR